MERLKAIEELLSDLDSLDIKLWVEGDDLKFNAPKGALTSKLRSQIKARKAELIDFLLRNKRENRLASPLVPIQVKGAKMPFFCVHPIGGNVFCYLNLSRQLGVEQPFYGLQASGFNQDEKPLVRIEEMASAYVKAIQVLQRRGAYHIGGWSFGGRVAFEIAQQFAALEHQVKRLIVIDTFPPNIPLESKPDQTMLVISFAQDLSRLHNTELPILAGELKQFKLEEKLNYLLQEAKTLQIVPPEMGIEQMQQLFAVFQANSQAMRSYVPKPYPGEIILFYADEQSERRRQQQIQGWSSLATGGIKLHKIAGNHFSMIRSEDLAKQLSSYLGL